MEDELRKTHKIFVWHAFEDGDYVIQIVNLMREMGLEN